MKKTFLPFCLSLAMIPAVVNAQTEKKAPGWAGLEPVQTKSFYLNDISTRATGDFLKRYPKGTDPKWYKIDDGYFVKFGLNDIQQKAVYDKTGSWVYSIKYYKENKLPRDIRHIVKRQYYDYTITQVEELHYQNNPVAYIVHMQDEKSWMNVKVCEGELSILEKFTKG